DKYRSNFQRHNSLLCDVLTNRKRLLCRIRYSTMWKMCRTFIKVCPERHTQSRPIFHFPEDYVIGDCIGATQTPNPPKLFRDPLSSRPKVDDYAEWKPEDLPRQRPIRIAEESSSGIAEKAFFDRILCGSVKRNLST